MKQFVWLSKLFTSSFLSILVYLGGSLTS